MRYELFKLKMLRDGYRDDKTLDMTDKEISRLSNQSSTKNTYTEVKGQSYGNTRKTPPSNTKYVKHVHGVPFLPSSTPKTPLLSARTGTPKGWLKLQSSGKSGNEFKNNVKNFNTQNDNEKYTPEVSTSKTVSINERVDKTATTATTNKTVEHGTPNKQQTTATGNIGNKSVEFPPHTAKGESDMETDSNKFPLKSTNNTIQMIFINSAVSFKTHGGLTLNSNNPEKDESQNNFKGLKFYERNTSRRTTNDVPANCTEIVRCDCTDMKTTSHGINFHQVKEVPTFIMRKKEGATKIEENQQTATKATVDIHSIETTTVPDNTSHITEPTTESTKVTDNTTHVTDPTTKTTTVTESTTEPTKVTKNTTHTTEPTTQTTTLTDTLRKIFSMHQSLKIKVSYHRS